MFTKKRLFTLLFFIAILIIGLPPVGLFAQDFNQGLQYYKQHNYKEAASVFNQIKNPEAYLFTGKSFYALGKYDEAQSNLNNIPSDAPAQIYEESLYTSALVNFQQKQFGQSLSKLYKVANSNSDDGLADDARNLYQQILGYLSAGQRQNAIENAADDEIRFDILRMGLDKVSYAEARKIYDTFMDHTDNDKWKGRGEQFKSSLRNASAFRDKFGSAATKLQPPEGTVYTLGVALPKYKPTAQEFGIVKSMYFGILLAAREFNDQHSKARVLVRFEDTGTSPDDIKSMMQQFKNKNYGDMLVGPLFSSQAEPAVSAATDLKIPTLAPLANSDIHAESSFLFQVNPTFAVHGRQMADYAVNELGLHSFAVIADRNSNGSASAEAFRNELDKLNADLQHFFVENLQSNDYELSKYTKYLNSDEPIDAVYAPFTGDRALTMIDLLIRDIRALDHPITILGSQEYRNLNFRSAKYHGLSMYFSESMQEDSHGNRLIHFKNAYQKKYGNTGNRFSMIGYDVANFMMETLNEVGNPDLLKNAIHSQRTYHGLVTNINFSGGNVNEAVKIVEVSSNGNLSALR